MTEHFRDFFEAATGAKPYPYQERLAAGEGPDDAPASLLIDVPTGAGKTAGVVLAWLWNRCGHSDGAHRARWPRRLIYCLPMRVLVEQTRGTVGGWLKNLREQKLLHEQVQAYTLMGGEVEDDWDLHPERCAILTPHRGTWAYIPPRRSVRGEGSRACRKAASAGPSPRALPRGAGRRPSRTLPADCAFLEGVRLYYAKHSIGTQDMLLSRALNRGYAESRFHWPVSFGLLNNDAFWVLDEVQLMGPGVATTAQLAAFRASLGMAAACPSIWMSATLNRHWLATVDFGEAAAALPALGLESDDMRDPALGARMRARKTLRRAPGIPGWKDTGYPVAVAELVRKRHRAGSLSLVVVNTVGRAKGIYRALREELGTKKRRRGRTRAEQVPAAFPDLVLIHSRFRPAERQTLTGRMLSAVPPQGRIVVATQVIEAGVDISARLLVTELAPWSSLVQRFGRCNRTGDEKDAEVIWLDAGQPRGDLDQSLSVPYEAPDLTTARHILRGLEGQPVRPTGLPKAEQEIAAMHVLRRKDVVDLFDTAPDISGNDLDISRFIRDADEREVQVFWRDWPGAERGAPPPEAKEGPAREELCPAPIGEFRDFLRRTKRAFGWDHLEDRWVWVRGNALRPGMMVLVPASSGGYAWDPARAEGVGWDPAASESVPAIPDENLRGPAPDSTSNDPGSGGRMWVAIQDHTEAVVRACEAILASLSLNPDLKRAILRAARWHDAGKAHEVFQGTLKASSPGVPPPRDAQLWAKSPGRSVRHSRPHFRHELASALALLGNPPALADLPEEWRDLVIYLAAAHHGKVRLSPRSLPRERVPGGGRRFVLGIWDGDQLPNADLGGGVALPATTLDLAALEIGIGNEGQPSWIERMLRLRDHPDLGPLRLAYLEALLRAADVRGSLPPAEEVHPHA